jgi:hypothetical protein
MTSLLFQIAEHLNSLSRDVTVGVLTSLWAGRPGNFGLIPGRGKRVTFPKCPAFCSEVSGDSYLGIKRPRREAARSPQNTFVKLRAD